MGSPAVSTRRTKGSSMPRGRSARTRATASFTSLSARSASVPNRKVIVVFETPSEINDMTWWDPATLATASSTFLVTCVSSAPGDAPNCVIKTVTRGTSTLGKRVIGSLLKLRYPITAIATAMIMGGTGCRIDHAETLTATTRSSVSFKLRNQLLTLLNRFIDLRLVIEKESARARENARGISECGRPAGRLGALARSLQDTAAFARGVTGQMASASGPKRAASAETIAFKYALA